MGSKTKAVAERTLDVIHHELDVAIKPDPQLRPQAPLYGSQTAQAVSKFRRQHGFEPDGNPDSDQVASLPVQRKLNYRTSKQTREMATALVRSIHIGLQKLPLKVLTTELTHSTGVIRRNSGFTRSLILNTIFSQ